MGFLEGLHGTIAVVLLCTLLYVDEAGVPLPVAPNEVLLLVAGLLIGTGALPAWLFFPAAAVAMTAGMLTGYGWARAVGESGLRAIAARLGATASYDRSRKRLGSARPVGIGLARLVPGVRPYVTLMAGAAGVGLRRFLLGAIPALLIWEAAVTTIGILVGLPAERLLGQVETLAVRGGLLVALGVGAFVSVRRIPADDRGGLDGLPKPVRLSLAAAVDGGIVASLVAGLLSVGRRVFQLTTRGWIDLVVVSVLVLVAYIVAGRRTAGATAGESLLHVSYRRIDRASAAMSGAPSWQTAVAAASVLHGLADPVRLHIAWLLLGGEQDEAELARVASASRSTVAGQLEHLCRAGIVIARRDAAGPRYRLNDDAARALLVAIFDHASTGGQAQSALDGRDPAPAYPV